MFKHGGILFEIMENFCNKSRLRCRALHKMWGSDRGMLFWENFNDIVQLCAFKSVFLIFGYNYVMAESTHFRKCYALLLLLKFLIWLLEEILEKLRDLIHFGAHCHISLRKSLIKRCKSLHFNMFCINFFTDC